MYTLFRNNFIIDVLTFGRKFVYILIILLANKVPQQQLILIMLINLVVFALLTVVLS